MICEFISKVPYTHFFVPKFTPFLDRDKPSLTCLGLCNHVSYFHLTLPHLHVGHLDSLAALFWIPVQDN